VPGAYQGRGHGNAFLNDLCGADVLIHVVDASGGTDKGGNPTEASFSGLGRREEKAKEEQDVYRPSDDVAWVRNEIHRWIYNNIQAKWASVVRLGVDRLVELLSGYHASRAVAAAALKRMGVDLKTISSEELRLWMPIDLHRLVAHFLRVRFPILLALNKCDHPDSEGHVQELLRRYDKEPHARVSALAELRLSRWRREGRVDYSPGSRHVHVISPLSTFGEELRWVQDVMANLGGSTGVLELVNAAVHLRPPLLVFPVADLETCRCEGPVQRQESLGVAGSWFSTCAAGSDHILRDVIVMKPGSSVQDVYETMKRPPWQMISGDFIRAECRIDQEQRKLMKKTDVVNEGTCVLKIMTNKRSCWQRK